MHSTLIRLTISFCIVVALHRTDVHAAGEPADAFLKQLRASKYFEMADKYLDRLDQYPGVPADFIKSLDLERAQTFIDAASATRNSKTQDKYFRKAEESLQRFLKTGTSSRQSEAQLRLGKIQMVRAAQLMSVEPSKEKRQAARESYVRASATFESVVETLREKLKEMRGAKIDAKNNPEKAALRDQHKAEFLEAMMRAGEAFRYAASTYDNPGKQAKPLLEKSLVRLTDLSEKYDGYMQGALALLSRGLVEEELGKRDQALDSFTRMIEAVDAPELRDAKTQATSGLIRLALSDKPTRYQEAIDRGAPVLKNLRPNERRSASAAELQLQLAKAYLAKSKDKKNQKPADIKRSETEARTLLLAASKVPGSHAQEVTKTLASIGIDKTEVVPPVPVSSESNTFEEALQKSQQLYQASEQLNRSIAAIKKQKDSKQKEELEKQLGQTRTMAIETLRVGLGMVTQRSEDNLVNQARQLLAYLLYQSERYRESSVVGNFLARNAPASEMGLRGGLLSLNSLQSLLRDTPDATALIDQLKTLGDYLSKTWPDDPQASAAKNVLVGLALESENWDEARRLIGELANDTSRSQSRTLLGQFLWAEAIKKIRAEEPDQATALMKEAREDLRAGLDGIQGALADQRAMKASLVLTKILLRLDQVSEAARTLKHPVYGASTLYPKFGNSDSSFASDLHGTELQIIVAEMTDDGVDMDASLKRAGQTMDKLRASVTGEGADKKLAAIYLRLARNIRDQLNVATPVKKKKLTQAFRVFLERVSATTKDEATLQWIGQTLMELSESSMQPGRIKATGQSAELLKTAAETFERLSDEKKKSPIVSYQIGRVQRLLGKYGDAINTFLSLLKTKETMIDAQVEAALAYEQWAQTLPPKFAAKSYSKAIGGAKPQGGKNVIWGWGKISQLTSRNAQNRATFFDARYHLALSRYQWGKSAKEKDLIRRSSSDITKVAALYPKLGGPAQLRKFDTLLKQIQKDLGERPTGLDK
jgi:tetratricopeptide (TPR) repeat protein